MKKLSWLNIITNYNYYLLLYHLRKGQINNKYLINNFFKYIIKKKMKYDTLYIYML